MYNTKDKQTLRVMLDNTIDSAQDSIKYASEMFKDATSCLDTPRITGTMEYLEVSIRRAKTAIKLLKKWREP